MRKILAVIFLGAALGGCATPRTGQTMVVRGLEPTKEQAEKAALRFLSTALKDPDSLKQFGITYGPIPMSWYRGIVNGGGHEEAWLICFQYNAKNSYGAYPGAKIEGLALRVVNDEAVYLPNVNWLVSNQQCPGT